MSSAPTVSQTGENVIVLYLKSISHIQGGHVCPYHHQYIAEPRHDYFSLLFLCHINFAQYPNSSISVKAYIMVFIFLLTEIHLSPNLVRQLSVLGFVEQSLYQLRNISSSSTEKRLLQNYFSLAQATRREGPVLTDPPSLLNVALVSIRTLTNHKSGEYSIDIH